MERTLWTLLAVAWLATLVGCTQTLSRDAFSDQVDQSRSNSLPDTTWYMGSDADFDYYYSGLSGICSVATYRVERNDDGQPNQIPVTQEQSKWRMVLETGQ